MCLLQRQCLYLKLKDSAVLNKITMKYKITVIAILSCFMAKAQLTENQIDTLVTRTMKTFDVPGIAVAVVKDGKVVLSKGYGVRSLNSKLPVDQHTLFGIASNSKAFTGAALAMLVDEKKISWDDKVIKHIPEFKMYNDYVTQEFTIRDLLTHRSGLGQFYPSGYYQQHSIS
jgi:CubicO group peptidase (beta-lactamase class C family)